MNYEEQVRSLKVGDTVYTREGHSYSTRPWEYLPRKVKAVKEPYVVLDNGDKYARGGNRPGYGYGGTSSHGYRKLTLDHEEARKANEEVKKYDHERDTRLRLRNLATADLPLDRVIQAIAILESK